MLCKISSTGVLQSGHSDDHGKRGIGAAFFLRHQAALEKRQNVLYLFGNKGLAVFDTTDPENPQRIGKPVSTGVLGWDAGAAAVIRGAYMYVAGGKGLRVFDVSTDNVFRPMPVGKVISTGALGYGGGAALKIIGNYMYLAGAKGLAVLSLADPAVPTMVGKPIETGVLGMKGDARICVVDNILRLLGGKGLATFSLADPALPQIVQSCISTGCIAQGGCIDWAEAPDGSMIVAGGKGLTFWDAGAIGGGSPTQLTRIGGVHDTGVIKLGGGVAMVVSDRTLYLAGGKGLGVFHLDGAPGPGNQLVDSRQIIFNTGVISGDNAAAMLLEGQTLWVAGGSGLAAFDVAKLLLYKFEQKQWTALENVKYHA